MAISSKGRLYGDYRAQGEDQTESARLAGYKHPNAVCTRLESDPAIQEYIAELTKDLRSARIATARERQEFWSSTLRGEKVDKDNDGNKVSAKMSDRLKASELLGKSQMDFVEKRIHEIISPADAMLELEKELENARRKD